MTKTIKRMLSIGLAVICTAVVGIAAIVTNGFNLGGGSPLGQGGVGKLSFGNFLNSGITLTASADESSEPQRVLSDTVRLTATITPELASNQNVDWSIAWKDASSEWATDKTVTDYVTATPTADGALTADVKCLQDFGETAIITVTSREDNTLSASCSVDYKKRYESIAIPLMLNNGISHYGFVYMNQTNFVSSNSVGIYDQFIGGTSPKQVAFSDYTIDSALEVVNGDSTTYYGYELFLMVKEETVTAFNEAKSKSLVANADKSRQSIWSMNNMTLEYFDCIYSNGTAISGSAYETLRNEFTAWLRAEEIYDAFYFELQLYDPENRNSVYFQKQYPVVFTAEGLVVAVESVTVDPSSVVF